MMLKISIKYTKRACFTAKKKVINLPKALFIRTAHSSNLQRKKSTQVLSLK